MTNTNTATSEVIAILHRAVHAASQDYFAWTRGHILWDGGVERMMQVYAATRLFEVFNPRYGAVVHLERPLSNLLPVETRESVDLTLEIYGGLLYAVEFKRYSNPATISADLTRLRNIVCEAGRVGLFVAPCYQKGVGDDWPIRQKIENEIRRPTETWHVSDVQSLRDSRADGFSHERALVIEVDGSPDL